MEKRFSKLLVLLLLICVPVMYAETPGTLSGTIKTPSGAAIPNAAVTLTNASTNASTRVLTAPDGTFSIVGVPPGTYKIDVEAAGYKRSSQQNLVLPAGGKAPINITLQLGNKNESVEIKARAPMIQTDNSEMAVGLNMRSVQELPVIDRNHQELVNLQTGITPPIVAFPLFEDPDRQRIWNTNGNPYWANRQGIDGAMNYEPIRALAIRVVPDEDIRQFNITSGNYTDNKGFAGGS